MIHQDKIMFEIYRDCSYFNEFRVVYFTELMEHNKETEINRAMAGEHFLDGYIVALKKERARERIDSILDRLNKGESVKPSEVKKDLAEFLTH